MRATPLSIWLELLEENCKKEKHITNLYPRVRSQHNKSIEECKAWQCKAWQFAIEHMHPVTESDCSNLGGRDRLVIIVDAKREMLCIFPASRLTQNSLFELTIFSERYLTWCAKTCMLQVKINHHNAQY